MTTIRADDVRIPRAAREALARHEEVVVLSRDRPVCVLVNPEDRQPTAGSDGRGRPLRQALDILARAPLPDDGFAVDIQAVLESVGPLPADRWERS